MTAISECVMVMLECIPFDGLMQRHQHLAREISKYMPVIYVELTPSRIRRIFDGKPLDPALNAHKKGLVEIGLNLQIFKAPPCVPRSTGFKRSIDGTARRTAQALKPLLPPGKKIITWLFSPNAASTFGLYDEIYSIFDYFDAFGEFPGEEKYRGEIRKALYRCVKNVDLVLATNRELLDGVIGYNSNGFLIQNGCDAEHFIYGGNDPTSESQVLDMALIQRPIIGYMGDLAPWFETDHIIHMARKHPEWSFVLLGTWKNENRPPDNIPNIYVPGRVPYIELPWYARQFDVGTIPFKLNDLTRVVNPLKLYEYFALGLPVVSTGLPEIARHEDLVYIASGPDEFLALTEVAVKEKSESPARKKRVEVARQNSWKARGETIMEILEEQLADK